MNEIKLLHREAMELLDQADLEKRRGHVEESYRLRVMAYEAESKAAGMTAGERDLEPTRSVLHRSAASLALSVGELGAAKVLIHSALMGDPPDDIEHELEGMLEDLTYRRHLQIRGIELTNNEVQLSLSGKGIGFGYAPINEVIDRISSARLLLTRTAERMLGRPYRPTGREPRVAHDLVTPFLSVPRQASFAISLRLGRTAQTAFDGLGAVEHLVDEMMDCLDLFSNGRSEALQERIGDADYFRNFLALSTAISPDGAVVDLVGFTSSRDQGDREVSIRGDRSQGEQMLLSAPLPESSMPKGRPLQPMEVSGLLRFADALHEKTSIKLRAGKKTYNIFVPSGIDDIVRPLWGHWVTISGQGAGKNIELRAIAKSAPPEAKAGQPPPAFSW